MPDATLDPDVLLDGLVGTVDALRDLSRQFGTAAYRLYRVVRTWDGDAVGDGTFTDVLTEILPRPLVEPYSETLAGKLAPSGLEEAGLVKVSEVSLSYTAEELAGEMVTDTAEQLLLIREGYGQGQADRYYRLDRPPFADRADSIGWILWLRLQQGAAPP